MCDLQQHLQALKQPLFGYVLRFALDWTAGTWQIVAKPIDGGPVRLFSNLEALFGYLERQTTLLVPPTVTVNDTPHPHGGVSDILPLLNVESREALDNDGLIDGCRADQNVEPVIFPHPIDMRRY